MQERIGSLIKKSYLRIEKRFIQALQPYGLTPAQYRVMVLLCRNQDKPLRQIDIEQEFGMTNPTVTGILQNMEKKDLVQRVENPADRRSKLVSATPKTLAIVEKVEGEVEQIEKYMATLFEPGERDELARLLKILNHDDCGKGGCDHE